MANRTVPTEPTEEMLHAYWQCSGESEAMKSRVYERARGHYRAFLLAAPEEPEDRIETAAEAFVLATHPPGRTLDNLLDTTSDKIRTAMRAVFAAVEPQNIPRFEPIKREDFITSLINTGIIHRDQSGTLHNARHHRTDLTAYIEGSLDWLNELQIDEPQGCMIFKVPLPEIEKLRDEYRRLELRKDFGSFEADGVGVNACPEDALTLDEGYTICAGRKPSDATAIAAVLNFVRKLI